MKYVTNINTTRYIINNYFSSYSHYDNINDNIFKMVPQYNSTHERNLYIMIQCLYKNRYSNAYVYYNYIENGFIDYDCIIKKMFYFIQRVKNIINKFIHFCKLRYSKVFNDRNTCFEPLKNNCLKLNEDGFNYNFDLFEIKKITKNCFNYSEYDIPIILKLKNPYTNKPFSLHNVYNIYFYLLKNYSVPHMFNNYMSNNMQLRITKVFNSIYLFVNCMERNYNTMTRQDKIFYIKKMFRMYEYDNICKMPNNVLYELFNKIAKYFYIYYRLIVSKFDNDQLLDIYGRKFHNKIKDFYMKNKNYDKSYYRKCLDGKYRKYTVTDIIF